MSLLDHDDADIPTSQNDVQTPFTTALIPELATPATSGSSLKQDVSSL